MPNIVEPKVTLLAHTTITPQAKEIMSRQRGTTDAEHLTVLAGRVCYQSMHRPNKQTAKDADYLNRTLFEQKHWAIAEHATATVYIEGVSRAFTHELIRHRHLSYSQLSQRFVDESYADIVMPPAIRGKQWVEAPAVKSMEHATASYRTLVRYLIGKFNMPRKQAREAARAVLPNMVETKIVVTGNLRAWHEVIERRTAPDADAEMREVMGLVKDQLHTVAPNLF